MRLASDLLVHVLHLLMHILHRLKLAYSNSYDHPCLKSGVLMDGLQFKCGGRQAGIYPSENFAATCCGKSSVEAGTL